MSARCSVDSYRDLKPEVAKTDMNLDVLARKLREVDRADYDHPELEKTFGYLSKLPDVEQRTVIKVALNQERNFDQLLDHVIGMFMIEPQKDEQGEYCGMGFGKECISVVTWNGHDNPKHCQDVDITDVCYVDKAGRLRCGHLLDMIEFIIEYKQMSFEQLCARIRK